MAVEVQTWWYVALSGALFALGAWGLLQRANAIRILLSIELMLNAANINFAAFSSHWRHDDGYTFALFSIAIAAAEAAVGLAIIVNLFRVTGHVETDQMTSLSG